MEAKIVFRIIRLYGFASHGSLIALSCTTAQGLQCTRGCSSISAGEIIFEKIGFNLLFAELVYLPSMVCTIKSVIVIGIIHFNVL